jgi:hypothetical protein
MTIFFAKHVTFSQPNVSNINSQIQIKNREMNTIGYITTTINWFGFFFTIFFAYYYYLKLRHKERILLIEKNVDIAELYHKRKKCFSWYIFSFTLIGISVGIFIGIALFIEALGMSAGSSITVFLIISTVLLFSAIGIIIGNSIKASQK